MIAMSLLAAALVINASPKDGALERARDAARRLSEAQRARGVEIVLAPGTYRLKGTLALDERDSGVIWRSDSRGQAVICDGIEIPPRYFRPADGGRLLSLDLAARGVRLPDPPEKEFLLPAPVPDLYVDGKPMTLAKWPNEGWATIERVIDPGTAHSDGSSTPAPGNPKAAPPPPRGGTFAFSGDRPLRWTDEPNVWLHGYWRYDWYANAIPLGSVNASSNTITLAAPHWYGLLPGNPSPRRWQALNARSELDEPGEYCVDYRERRLYLMPQGRFTSRTKVVLTDAARPLVELRNCRGVTFRGIELTQCWSSAVKLSGCTDVTFADCRIRNVRELAVKAEDCLRCRVENCVITGTGTGGVAIGGGDRRTLEPGSNVVENCVIRDFSTRKLCYASAIQLNGVGNAARHNELSGAPHMAVGIAGNDHVIEYNVISNVCTASDDAAAIYKGRNPTCRGNVIRWNLITDVGSERGHGTAAIYFDDGDCGDLVFGNVFLRCGSRGKGGFGTVFCHGGHSNAVRNCIFADSGCAFGSSPWKQEKWAAYIASQQQQDHFFKDVCITGAVWLARYPAIAALPKVEPDEARWNLAERNLLVDCAEMCSGRWATNATDVAVSLSTRRIADLVAEARRLVPGFEPIPVERFGRR